EQFKQRQCTRRTVVFDERGAAPSRQQIAEEKEVTIGRPHERAGQVLWLFQPPHPHPQPIPQRLHLEIQQGADHRFPRASPVARKKTSSRLASLDCSENFCRISPIVPSMTLMPL